MRTMSLCVLALAASAAAQNWCVTEPVHADRQPTVAAELKGDFRGSFRDFALFVDTGAMSGCKGFAPYKAGNDGLWVLEFRNGEDKVRELAKAYSNGLSVVFETNSSAVVQGGEEAPDKLGYDACGAEKRATIISVSPTSFRLPQPMTPKQLAYKEKSLKAKNSYIQDAVDRITVEDMEAIITHLENYNSRNSYTGSNLVQAMQWLFNQYSAVQGVNASRHIFRNDMAAQVFADIPGELPNSFVIIGAHADSRSTQVSNPTQRAPGADDNGSGTAALVLIARAIKASGIRFKHTIRLMSFTGEEQGLLGSRAIASEYRASGVHVEAMVNGDMIGYRLPNSAATLAYMNRQASVEWSEWSAEITAQYVPGLATGWTAGCCSDQQSFHENGFHSIGLFEHPGNAVQYPQYHTSSDLLQYMDPEQLMLQARAMLASALVIAEPLDG